MSSTTEFANAHPLDEGARFPLCRSEPLGNLFAAAFLGGRRHLNSMR